MQAGAGHIKEPHCQSILDFSLGDQKNASERTKAAWKRDHDREPDTA